MPFTVQNRRVAVTICALNYLGRALVLRKSFLAFHADCDFYVLLVERKVLAVEERNPGVSILWAEDLGIPRFFDVALKFDIVELSTNVKPTVLRRLLERYDSVIYIDPDIQVYAYMAPVFEALASHSVVVTPHALTPVLDGKTPADDTFSRMGAFNLGFVGVRRCDEAFAFLDWWSERCLKLGFYEPQSGLAVDQKWVDLAPCYFPNLMILRDLGVNVAFWNLHERVLSQRDGAWVVNGTSPLYFFHFSSFSDDEPHAIAHKQSRFAAGSRPDLHPLLDAYASLLGQAGHDAYAQRPYSFDYFEDGAYVTPTLRRVFAALEDRLGSDEDHFAAGSAVHRFALKRRLAMKGYEPAGRHTFKDLGRFSLATRLVQRALSFVLWVVGPNRYFMLMKYLVYVSSIRNQRDLVRVDD